MSDHFYFSVNGEVKGPVDRETMFYLAQEGGLPRRTRVCQTNAEEWYPAELIDGVFNWHLYCQFCEQRLLVSLSIQNTEQACPACGENFLVPPPDFDYLDSLGDSFLLDTELVEFEDEDSEFSSSLSEDENDWTSALVDDTEEGALVCPHCWFEFELGDIKYVSRHSELCGDPVLGDDEQQRFTPSRFAASGHALDSRGLECPDKACPRCHLVIPESFIDFPAVFFSIAGAPSSGKSYFLTSMISGLRNLLSKHFDLDFFDASPLVNAVLNDYEEKLFLNPDPEKIVALPKTELQGESFTNQVAIDGVEMNLPCPFIFVTRLAETHPEYNLRNADLNHNIVFYDNAGEHFQPGQDSVANPATHHLKESSGIIFLFDPSIDPRMRRLCQTSDPQLEFNKKVTPQERLFNETMERLRKYAGMTSRDKYPYPIIINVAKFDIWSSLLNFNLQELTPWKFDRDNLQNVLDIEQVMEVSYAVREVMMDVCPNFVQMAENFCEQVYFVPTSSLGTSPELLEQDQGRTNFGVRPQDISPIWSNVPALILLVHQGYIKASRLGGVQKDSIVTPENYKILQSKIMLSPDGNSERVVVPLLYSGCTIYHRETEQWLRVPEVEESMLDDMTQDKFWES